MGGADDFAALPWPPARDAGGSGLQWRAGCLRFDAMQGVAALKEPGVALCPLADLPRLLRGEGDAGRRVEAALPAAALDDAALVLRPRGRFVSTDALALERWGVVAGQWQVRFDLQRRENQDGEPAPAVLLLVLRVWTGQGPGAALHTLNLRFRGRRFGFHGDETGFTGPRPMRVDFGG